MEVVPVLLRLSELAAIVMGPVVPPPPIVMLSPLSFIVVAIPPASVALSVVGPLVEAMLTEP